MRPYLLRFNVAVMLAIVGVIIAAIGLSCAVTPCHAAQFVALRFTSPDPGSLPRTTFEAQRGSVQDGWSQAKLYRSPSATDPWQPTVLHAGDSLLAYVSLTQTPTSPYGSRRGGQAIRLRPVPCDAAGVPVVLADTLQTPWSNYVAVAAGCRDTLFFASRDWMYPTAGLVAAAMALDDTLLGGFSRCPVGPVSCYEDAVMRGTFSGRPLYRYLCDTFGFYGMRGVRVPCPPAVVSPIRDLR